MHSKFFIFHYLIQFEQLINYLKITKFHHFK